MATGVGSAADRFAGEKQHSMRFIVAASGAGTVIEWYDFYIFGSLATLMAVKFFHAADTGAFLLTLGTFAAGFAVRPFGAVVFGRIGDLVGRKYASSTPRNTRRMSAEAIGRATSRRLPHWASSWPWA